MSFPLPTRLLLCLVVVLAPRAVAATPVAQAYAFQNVSLGSVSESGCTTYLLLSGSGQLGPTRTVWASTSVETSGLDCEGCGLAVQTHSACCQGVRRLLLLLLLWWGLMGVVGTGV